MGFGFCFVVKVFSLIPRVWFLFPSVFFFFNQFLVPYLLSKSKFYLLIYIVILLIYKTITVCPVSFSFFSNFIFLVAL